MTLSSSGRFRGQLKDDLPELPDHYRKKLAAQVKDLVKNKRKRRERLSPEHVEKIRMCFFNFFVGVF